MSLWVILKCMPSMYMLHFFTTNQCVIKFWRDFILMGKNMYISHWMSLLFLTPYLHFLSFAKCVLRLTNLSYNNIIQLKEFWNKIMDQIHSFYTPVRHVSSQIAKYMGPTWDPPGSCRPQMGPKLAPWTLLWGILWCCLFLRPTIRQLCT